MESLPVRRGMHDRLLGTVCALLLLLAPQAPAQENPSFEETDPGTAPSGWLLPSEDLYDASVVEGGPDGARCLRVRSTELVAGGGTFGNTFQMVDAAPFRGSLVTLRAHIRTEDAERGAHMWMRVDREGGQTGFFDNMQDNPVRVEAWAEYTMTGLVDDDAKQIAIGVFLLGSGSVWIDGVRLERVDGAPGLEPARPIDDAHLGNLEALARLGPALRFFNPADEGQGVDWDLLMVRAVRHVEDAPDADELAGRFERLFRPHAPTLRVWTGAADDDPGSRVADAMPGDSPQLFMRNIGVAKGGRGARPSIYSSQRRRFDPAGGAIVPDSTTERIELGPGLWAAWSIVVDSDGGRTQPRADLEAFALPDPLPEAWRPIPGDRASRIASTIEAWGLMRHFYPYWDVTDTEWDDELVPALAGSATAETAAEYQVVLERLIAKIRDGHGGVYSPWGRPSFMLPARAEWARDAEGRTVLCIAQMPPLEALEPGGLARGDVVLSIDGRTTEELYADWGGRISAAGEAWLRSRTADAILKRETDTPITVRVRRAGETKDLTIEPVRIGTIASLRPERPDNAAELAEGVFYYDTNGAEWNDLRTHLRDFAGARAIIFDARGYPDSAGKELLSHLTDERIHSAWWNTPVYPRPFQRDVEFLRSRWDINASKPRLNREGGPRVVFLAGGGAISYAESCLAVVEAYGLADIVGSTTAGSNGNIIAWDLPTGYRIIWTGMKVTKHDDSRHHGVGVAPTHAARPTVEGLRAGRDEVLEAALELIDSGDMP